MVITAVSPVQWVNFGSGCVGAAHRLTDVVCGREADLKTSNRLVIKVSIFWSAILIVLSL